MTGASADDVLAVVREVHQQRLRERAPWRAGLFYLLSLAVTTIVVLAVSHVVSAWLVPVVAAAALVGVVVVGALQQRQDGRISESGLLDLLRAALRTARTLGGKTDPGA